MRPERRTIVILILTVLLLAFFLRNANLHQVWVEMRRARLDLLVLATTITAAAYPIRALRWWYLLLPIGRVRLLTAFRTTVIGFSASFFLPLRAGEFVRPYLLARHEGISATATFATVVLERLLDAATVLLLLGTFLLLFDPGIATADPRMFGAVKFFGALSAAAALVALFSMFSLAGHPERLGRAALRVERLLPARAAPIVSGVVQRFAEGLAVMRQPRRLLVAVALSLPLWLSIALGIWLVSRAFYIDLPYTGSFLLMALVVIGVAAPTPGAIGGFHAAYQFGAIAFYDVPNDTAVGAAVVLHAVSWVPVTVLGIVFMAREGLNLSRMRSLAWRSGQAAPPDRGAARAAEPGSAPANGSGGSTAALVALQAGDQGEPG